MSETKIRAMEPKDWSEVADLIYLSTNYWYQTHGRDAIFRGDSSCALLFCQVYEDLDPGCCLLAEHTGTGRIMASCFYHPRETHVSLGIMNVHPNYFGRGLARKLLEEIIAIAKKDNKPVRLVSSAMNLDSFSLYTRAGFVPRRAFQDMYLAVPESGITPVIPDGAKVRDACPADVEAMVDLEEAISGIRRAKDYQYFIENARGIWHTSVLETDAGIQGFLVSVHDPGSNMLGPGVAKTEAQAFGLITAEFDQHRGRAPVFLAPVDCGELVQRLYGIKARNCEAHFCQVLGEAAPFQGVIMPTFMPETG